MNKATPTEKKTKEIRIEDQVKRFRVTFGGETIADSVRTRLLFEDGHFPVIYFPFADLRRDLLVGSDHGTHCPWKGDAAYWSIKVGDQVAENAVWYYPTPLPACERIEGYASFMFKAVDWLEEDTPLYAHARSPYTRIDTLRSSRRVVVKAKGETLADTTRAVFLYETGLPPRYYIPADDCRMEVMSDSETKTVCPYKGIASYYTASLPGGAVQDIAWHYPDPWPEVALMKDHLAFYPDRVDSIEVAEK